MDNPIFLIPSPAKFWTRKSLSNNARHSVWSLSSEQPRARLVIKSSSAATKWNREELLGCSVHLSQGHPRCMKTDRAIQLIPASHCSRSDPAVGVSDQVEFHKEGATVPYSPPNILASLWNWNGYQQKLPGLGVAGRVQIQKGNGSAGESGTVAEDSVRFSRTGKSPGPKHLWAALFLNSRE